MLDYGFNFMNTKIYIDNESTICIVKNPVFHSKTKHIEIRHHFIRDSYEKKLIQVIKIHTDHTVADLLTKAFDSSGPINLVADETVYKEWEDRMEKAATTTSSIDAEQDSGAMLPYWEMQMLKLGLRLHLNSPMIHLSQVFWATTKAKTVNGECQLQALIDKKKVIIMETIIRSDLHLEDAGGIDCLPTATIFEELARMGPSDSTADVPNEEHVPTHSNDPLISAKKITNLKLRVKKLEKKAVLGTHKFKRLYKGRSRIKANDRDVEVTLVETQRRNDENDDNLMFDTGVFDGDEIVVETEEPVSTDEIDLAQEITLAQALAAMKSAKPK
ncbi:hypothetical protein Tco_0659973, partial [Tanacetum coccineum]